jgi:hypothetical protein
MKYRALLKIGAFLISGGIFNKVKGECYEDLGKGGTGSF